MYERLLADPTVCWTVQAMVAAAPDSVHISPGLVRDIFYRLASEGILRVVPKRHPLTFATTHVGVLPLRRMVELWKDGCVSGAGLNDAGSVSSRGPRRRRAGRWG